jgi:Big-like domain-containing protein
MQASKPNCRRSRCGTHNPATITVVSAELISATKRVRPGQELKFALVNHGPGKVGLGEAFRLERKNERGWEDVAFGDETMAWRAFLRLLGPHERSEQAVRIPQSAMPGHYRVVKDLEWDEPMVSCEFEVIMRRRRCRRSKALPRF